jgi:hypothetical protein
MRGSVAVAGFKQIGCLARGQCFRPSCHVRLIPILAAINLMALNPYVPAALASRCTLASNVVRLTERLAERPPLWKPLWRAR